MTFHRLDESSQVQLCEHISDTALSVLSAYAFCLASLALIEMHRKGKRPQRFLKRDLADTQAATLQREFAASRFHSSAPAASARQAEKHLPRTTALVARRGGVHELMPLINRFFFAVRAGQTQAPLREIRLWRQVEGIVRRGGHHFRMNETIFAMMTVQHPLRHPASLVPSTLIKFAAAVSDFLYQARSKTGLKNL